MRVYYSILISLLFQSGHASNCSEYDYQFQSAKGIVKSRLEMCFKKDFFYSKNCLKHECINYQEIKSMQRKRQFDVGRFDNRYGTREFKICHELGGQGQVFTFFKEGRGVKTARCLFENKSFVESSVLEYLYLKRSK